MHSFDLSIRNTLEMRRSNNQRTFEQLAPFEQLAVFEQLVDLNPNFVFFTKKNKMKKFPTKMKRKIGAPKGRQLCGAPNGALIMPNSVTGHKKKRVGNLPTVTHLFIAGHKLSRPKLSRVPNYCVWEGGRYNLVQSDT